MCAFVHDTAWRSYVLLDVCWLGHLFRVSRLDYLFRVLGLVISFAFVQLGRPFRAWALSPGMYQVAFSSAAFFAFGLFYVSISRFLALVIYGVFFGFFSA